MGNQGDEVSDKQPQAYRKEFLKIVLMVFLGFKQYGGLNMQEYPNDQGHAVCKEGIEGSSDVAFNSQACQ